MLRVSFVTMELRLDERRITGSPLGCQRPLRLLSPPPSPVAPPTEGWEGPATITDLLREDHRAFSSFRVAIDLQQSPRSHELHPSYILTKGSASEIWSQTMEVRASAKSTI